MNSVSSLSSRVSSSLSWSSTWKAGTILYLAVMVNELQSFVEKTNLTLCLTSRGSLDSMMTRRCSSSRWVNSLSGSFIFFIIFLSSSELKLFCRSTFSKYAGWTANVFSMSLRVFRMSSMILRADLRLREIFKCTLTFLEISRDSAAYTCSGFLKRVRGDQVGHVMQNIWQLARNFFLKQPLFSMLWLHPKSFAVLQQLQAGVCRFSKLKPNFAKSSTCIHFISRVSTFLLKGICADMSGTTQVESHSEIVFAFWLRMRLSKILKCSAKQVFSRTIKLVAIFLNKEMCVQHIQVSALALISWGPWKAPSTLRWIWHHYSDFG